jgi:cysteine desulfurase
MLPYFTEEFGNPESTDHAFGWAANQAVEKARVQVAKLLNAEANEITFTSGATESLHLAILGFMIGQKERRHLITSNVEHKATLEICKRAQSLGHDLTILKADQFGMITAQNLIEHLRPDTVLVSLMHGNNEIGTLNPIEELAEVLADRAIAFHVDACQTAGKQEIDVGKTQINMLSLSGHKCYAPKGTGALFARRSGPGGVALKPYLIGGGHERGLRAGSVNVPGIVGLGRACEIAELEMRAEGDRLTQLRDIIIKELTSIKGVELNGHPTRRLCNNINLTFQGIAPEDLRLKLKNFAYSAGSACTGSGVSHVLDAIGRAPTGADTTVVRFGLGRSNTEADVRQLIAGVKDALLSRT